MMIAHYLHSGVKGTQLVVLRYTSVGHCSSINLKEAQSYMLISLLDNDWCNPSAEIGHLTSINAHGSAVCQGARGWMPHLFNPDEKAFIQTN